MRASYIAVCLLLACPVFGQRHKPIIDPESKEGYAIQLIQQERDSAQKIKLLKDFVGEFPKSPSLSWAYDQLQPAFLEGKEFEKVIEAGTRMIELDPQDLEAAHSMLLASEALKSEDLIFKHSVLCWEIATKLLNNSGYKKIEYVKQMIGYTEHSIASLGNGAADAAKRDEYRKKLEQLNPSSPWLHAAKSEFASLSEQGASKDKLAEVAEKNLVDDPNNEDMLMLVADYHMSRGDAPDKVFDYASRTLEILRTKARPGTVSQEDWDKKKEQYLGAAYYMVGVISSIQGRYAQADRSLRAALPTLKAAGAQVMGAALYHLGYANYQLAEKGERGRVFEAIRFNEQCATIPSSYRDQAQKNIESIKIEYNLK